MQNHFNDRYRPDGPADYFSLGPQHQYSGYSGRGHQYGGGGGRQRDNRDSRYSGPWGVKKHQGQNRGYRYQQQDAVPSLHKLRRDNAGQARKHFGHSDGTGPSPSYAPGSTPRSVPRAPNNDNIYLSTGAPLISPALHGAGFHLVTPNAFGESGFWKNSYSTVDKDAAELGTLAGFDMYGSNAGLIAKASVGADDEDEDVGAFSDSDQEDDYALADGEAGISTAARARLEEQAAYIAELEEKNLNLQERIYLLEQQLAESRQRGQVPASELSAHCSHSEDEGQEIEDAAQHADDALDS